jgi:hypothetical protein
VTAQQESDESKAKQEKGWHVLQLFVSYPFQVYCARGFAVTAITIRPINFRLNGSP